MIGFSIMMWFVSMILCIVSISLLRGNTASMHGKVYETTKDKVGFGKAIGKVVLFMSICILTSGIVALLGTTIEGVRNVLIVFAVMAVISAYCFINIQKKFSPEEN